MQSDQVGGGGGWAGKRTALSDGWYRERGVEGGPPARTHAPSRTLWLSTLQLRGRCVIDSPFPSLHLDACHAPRPTPRWATVTSRPRYTQLAFWSSKKNRKKRLDCTHLFFPFFLRRGSDIALYRHSTHTYTHILQHGSIENLFQGGALRIGGSKAQLAPCCAPRPGRFSSFLFRIISSTSIIDSNNTVCISQLGPSHIFFFIQHTCVLVDPLAPTHHPSTAFQV